MEVIGFDCFGTQVVGPIPLELAEGMSWGVREDFEKGIKTIATNWCANNPTQRQSLGGGVMDNPQTYIPPTKILGGIVYEAPSPVYPDAWVPVVLSSEALRDMSFGDLCDALKACFYREPGGTDTVKCAALIREIRESFKHSSY